MSRKISYYNAENGLLPHENAQWGKGIPGWAHRTVRENHHISVDFTVFLY